MLQGYWTNEFGDNAPAGPYKDKSYWLCTEYWPGQNFPIDLDVYDNAGGFSNGSVPLFIVVGFLNKVFYDGSAQASVQQAVRDAIDSFPTGGVYLINEVSDKNYLFSTVDVIDISNVFRDFDGDPLTLTVGSNTDPSIATASIVGTNLTITASGVNSGTTTITLKGEDVAHGESDVDAFNVTTFDPNAVSSVIEDFETGNFTKIPWTFGGSANWEIGTTSPKEGTYCAKSRDIIDSQTSEMIVSQTLEAPGCVSFYYSVSSESGYDFLRFYVDDVMQGEWTGRVDWTYFTYDLYAGTHSFKWSYEKDGSVTNGTDNAFIDYIEFSSGDAKAPVVGFLHGDKVKVGNPMVLNIEINESTGVDYIKARYTIDGTPTTVDMTLITKSKSNSYEGIARTKDGLPMSFSKNASKAVSHYTCTIPAETTGKVGTVKFLTQDIVLNSATSDDYPIEWVDALVYEGFESGVFPIPGGWQHLYNTAADGGLNGANLTDPSAATWFSCDPTNFGGEGARYIYHGGYSAVIDYLAPEFNWLISPQMNLGTNSAVAFMTWYKSNLTLPVATFFHILVDDGGGWVPVLNWGDGTPDNTWTSEVNVDLSTYDNSIIRIAFVYNYNNAFQVALDDVKVTTTGSGPVVPAVPANIVTSISGSDIVVDWDVSAGATSYDVYSSDDPYGTFTLAANVGSNQYTVPASQAKLFYYVVAKN